MDFFEKIGRKASETYKTAAEKTNKIATEKKLKLKMHDSKSKINDIYEEIGKKVYQKFVLDGNLDIKDDIEKELNRIKELSDEITELEKQILELSDKRECMNCRNKIEKEARFCSYCGAEQPKEEVEVKHDKHADEIASDVEQVVIDITNESSEDKTSEQQSNEEQSDQNQSENNN